MVFGSTVAGRPLELDGIEAGIGSFINTIPFRAKLDVDIALNDWLAQIQALQSRYRQWEFSSLAQLKKQTEISADSDLFESILVFENYPVADRQDGRLRVAKIEHFERSNYPLALLIVPQHEIELILIGDSVRYEAPMLRQMLEHLDFVLAEFVNDPTLRLGLVLDRLPPNQIQKLAQWNRVEPNLESENASIDQLIQSVAFNRPDATAVAFEGERLTYGELEQQSSQVAKMLVDAGVQLNEPVGLCLDRSLEMIVGVLGILKSGGCYVPLDTIYPEAHFQHVLDDADIKIVLTGNTHRSRLAGTGERKLIFIDDLPNSAESADLPLFNSKSDRRAYIIYTSGSTGKPKGVVISHQNLIHSTRARSIYYDEDPQSYLLMSSIAFDSSVAGIFWTLCAGGKLVVPRQDAEQDLVGLLELIRTEQVTHLLCLPVLYQLLAEASQPHQLDSLRVAIVAGESVSPEVVKSHFAVAPNAQLHNEYGPTEGTVWATGHQVRLSDARSMMPIGKPIQNVGVVLFDANGWHVPIGAIGEIFLTGNGLAAEYLNRPELTDERFSKALDYNNSLVPMYRTGDLGYFNDEGVLFFCGRVDNQVKIRGYRVELGEIESAIAACDNVTDVAVIAHRPSENASFRLAAFISSAGTAPDPQTWAQRLDGRLPRFMIPDTFVHMNEIPKLPNGKIDRASLPTDIAGNSLDQFRPPRNPVETKLAKIWAETIGVRQVGIHDNFFSLGGDSIISIQVISRARREGILIQPRDIARFPTVAALAEQAKKDVQCPISDVQATDASSLTPVQQWFFELGLTHPQHWNQSQLFRVAKDCDWEKLQRAICCTIAVHPMLQARFFCDEKGWKQQIAGEQKTAQIEVYEFDPRDPDSFSGHFQQLQSSLNIEQGPVFRLARFKNTAGGADQLLFVVHHLVIDLVSWRILIDDIEFAYRELTSHREVNVPAESCSYVAWSQYLSTLAQSASITEQLEYWMDVLSTTNELPADFSAKTVGKEDLAETVTRSFDAEIADKLRRDANEAYHTNPMDLLICCLATTIANWTDQSEILIELESHGRSVTDATLDVSRTVGWFTSAFPIRLAVDAADTGSTIKSVKEQMRDSRRRYRFQLAPIPEHKGSTATGQSTAEVAI